MNKIYEKAPKCYDQAIKDNAISESLIIDENGFFTIIKIPEGYISYLSFENDIDDDSLFLKIKEKLLAVEREEGDYLFLTINGANRNALEYFGASGFRKNTDGLEYRLTATGKGYELPPDHEIKNFEMDNFEEYVWLFDKAYHEPLVAEDLPPNPFSRNRQRTHDMFVEADEKGGFGALWKGGKLIGAYLLQGSTILDIVVFPLYQKQGSGSVILKHVTGKLAKDHDSINLYVSRSNVGARAFFQKHGFEETASHVDFVFIGLNK